MKHNILFFLLIAATLLLTPLLNGQNPVLDGADPHAIVIDDTVWIYPTYRSVEGFFFAFSSKDLVSWEKHGPLLKFEEIDWIPERKYAWAPGIVEKDGEYYFHYYRGVILTSDENHKGPGHHSIIQDPHSEAWLIVYHRWNDREGDGPYRGSRAVVIDRLVHEDDGRIRPVKMTGEGVTISKR